MPLSGPRIPLEEVVVNRSGRQRSEVKTLDLESSVRRNGVLQPIILEKGSNLLVAGERRLETSRKLGLPDIPYRYAEDLTAEDLAIIELEENVKRSDLPWQDIVRATGRIHRLFLAREGEEWTQTATAEALSISNGTCSLYLSVERELDNERVVQASTVREAFNFLERKRQRLADEDLEEFLAPLPVLSGPDRIDGAGHAPPVYAALLNGAPPAVPGTFARPLESRPSPDQSILITSFLDFAPKYAGPKFNLIHCDFPYGLAVDSNQMMNSRAFADGRGYEDKTSDFEELLACLIENFDRLLSVSGHLMFWYTADAVLLHELLNAFSTAIPSLSFYKFPLVWLKSDNAGIAMDTQRWPRHIYEVCLLASRGQRFAVHLVGDAYAAPTDNRLHASAKPEPMLRHFMRMLVDESTSLLDPTCGSGAALRAAESLGAKRVLGLEVVEDHALSARNELRKARVLREAELRLKDKSNMDGL